MSEYATNGEYEYSNMYIEIKLDVPFVAFTFINGPFAIFIFSVPETAKFALSVASYGT